MIIEKEIRDYLIKVLDVPVYIEIPPETPARYVDITLTGGSERNYIKHATVAIRSSSKTSLAEAAQLNEQVKEALYMMPFEANVYSVKFNNNYDFTNTQTKVHRYQAVYDITY